MSVAHQLQAVPAPGIDRLWYTRCNVPTASGIAFNLGWLADRYGRDGMTIGALQDAPLEIARHHYDHLLPGLIREGGNVPALVARSNGAPTRLIGLTWIDEQQIIAVRPESGIAGPRDLAGRRIAVPAFTGRGETSMARAMALHGFENALALAGLTLADVEIIDVGLEEIVPPGRHRKSTQAVLWPGLDLVEQGAADALYLKGAAAGRAARAAGLVVAVDLDATPDRRSRVNNGTPRPLTVHEDLLAQHPDWVVAFLAETLRAADWAAADAHAVKEIVARETQAPVEEMEKTYGPDFHATLHPDLSGERLGLLGIQKDFLLRHGFLARDFDLADWVEPGPLQAARRLLEG
ncbi:ABC transporter substrate-binding protein [Aquabacter sp. CN5-332]|uniref:ABC transporter substrate-binding protein n=1 Tax=Aquabacter sp. CN5-332 TaxID=3156608 RepID=UPI0032B624DF